MNSALFIFLWIVVLFLKSNGHTVFAVILGIFSFAVLFGRGDDASRK